MIARICQGNKLAIGDVLHSHEFLVVDWASRSRCLVDFGYVYFSYIYVRYWRGTMLERPG